MQKLNLLDLKKLIKKSIYHNDLTFLFYFLGDWDRRNRLKVYEGLYAMSIRDFLKAANLFLETISTFTSYELMDYDLFVKYAVYCRYISRSQHVFTNFKKHEFRFNEFKRVHSVFIFITVVLTFLVHFDLN